MNIFQAAILGFVEGFTEYLPISSTFHLIWTSNFLGIANTDFQKAFEVIIQGGAILAVVVLYWKKLLADKQLIFKAMIGFIPTAIIGLGLYKIIKNIFFTNSYLQIFVFIAVGILFILFEKLKKSSLTKELNALTYPNAIIIGLIQSLAVIPGVSRSGAVMLGLMWLGFKRDESALFSFYLAVPTLLAASGLDLIKSLPTLATNQNNIGILIVGFIVSFFSAMIFIQWLIKFLSKNTLISFGVYRIVLGGIILFLSLKLT